MSTASSMFEGWMYDIKLRAAEQGYEREFANLVNRLVEAEESRAAIIADRAALHDALERVAPDHALLVDDSLRDSIRSAGQDCYKRFLKEPGFEDRVRLAHKAIPYEDNTPSVKSLQQQNSELQAKLKEMEDVNVQNYAEKHLLREALVAVNPQHPLLNPTPATSLAVAAVHRAGLIAFMFSGGSYQAVVDAARTLDVSPSGLEAVARADREKAHEITQKFLKVSEDLLKLREFVAAGPRELGLEALQSEIDAAIADPSGPLAKAKVLIAKNQLHVAELAAKPEPTGLFASFQRNGQENDLLSAKAEVANAEAAYQAALDVAFPAAVIEAKGASLIEWGNTKVEELEAELTGLQKQLKLFEPKSVNSG